MTKTRELVAAILLLVAMAALALTDPPRAADSIRQKVEFVPGR